MKAATAFRRKLPEIADISIHAAREGGDAGSEFVGVYPNISIHAAREGGDSLLSIFEQKSMISIHAAREGGDGGNE